MEHLRSPGVALLLATCSLLTASCYQPDYTGAKFQCDPAQGGSDCPPGLGCIRGICQLPVDAPDEGTAPSGDMRGTVATDMTGQPVPPGCKNTGIMLNDDPSKAIWACDGMFDNKAISYRDLCADGFHVCGDDILDGSRLLNYGLRIERCTGAFYATHAAAWSYTDKGDNKVACVFMMGMGDMPAISGCGSEPPSIGVVNDCFNMKAVVPCPMSAGKPWSCAMGLSDAKHTAKMGGVVCCKDNS